MKTTNQTHSRHVVILGGGFGGLECAKRLIGSGCRVTLVDKQNYHLFQPLLYQVATAGLSRPEIAHPLRSILPAGPDMQVVMDEVIEIDLEQRRVIGKRSLHVYDDLVIALGATTGYFGKPEWAQHTIGLKTMTDAVAIRRKVLLAYERAEQEECPAERERLMTFVVIGGGPTGVETAGSLVELARHVLKQDFVRIDPSRARVILVEGGNRLLSSFSENLSQYTRSKLEEMGVQVITGSSVIDIQPRKVILKERTIEAETILWTAGIEANGLLKSLPVEKDRVGRLRVSKDCSLPGYPNVFAIGDIVSIEKPGGGLVPGVSPAAIQMGRHVAKIIRNESLTKKGDTPPPRPEFRYFDKGSMATIGRTAAVAQIGRFEFTGLIAWLLWLFVHLIFLIGFRNKLAVLHQWIYSYVHYKRGARII